MTELSLQQCPELSAGDVTTLNKNNITELLSQLTPAWELGADKSLITYSFTFNNYYQTMAFVNVAAQIAHQQGHHPDLHISYNHCKISYSTHSVNGLSIKDFICAAKINAAQAL